MSLTTNSRVYLLTLVAYLGAFIFGYDTGVAGGILQMQGFRHDFGLSKVSSAQTTNITSHVVSILQGGSFFGALLGAPLSELIGRRSALIVVSVIFFVGGALQVAGMDHLSYIYGGRFVAGLGVGAMSMLGPTYVAEVAPKQVRGRITGLFQVCLTLGICISYWLVYGGFRLVNVHFGPSSKQWRIPMGFQLAPVLLMFFLLFFCKESPRWLARHGKEEQSLITLAWFRKLPVDDPCLGDEFTEILATVKEERESKGALSECLQRGHWIRFVIAFTMFTLQQWSGQNSIGYYAPQVFKSIGIGGTNATLFASGVYGLVKLVATTLFLFVGIEQFGRKRSLIVGAFLMGMFFFILGALFQTHPPDPAADHPSKTSIGMAVLIYLYVIPYCFSWGPVPWVYSSEIFSNSLRSYGVAWAAATQWMWNFVVSYVTPLLEDRLSHGGVFFFFASINIVSSIYSSFLPETRGLSLEDMDILFGAITPENRLRDRLLVQNNLMGEPHHGHDLWYPRDKHQNVYPLQNHPIASHSGASVQQTSTDCAEKDSLSLA